ncbi:hypothetical protein QMO46_14445 [Microbacterium barkeri]|uniref:hypothetical protein n=1 Tax=Microbacterium barkeri TaxID=33917 RepID=UPI0024AF6C12|nr:hypothetical protein [Microbacterium barkeri]MDI6944693.1 hypothetical protein [Microbacterium barkeri]
MSEEQRVPEGVPAAGPEPADRPRIRWAAIIWGALMLVVSLVGLGQVLDATRYAALQAAVADWILTADPVSTAVTVVLAAGAIILVAGLAGLARGVQKRSARR